MCCLIKSRILCIGCTQQVAEEETVERCEDVERVCKQKVTTKTQDKKGIFMCRDWWTKLKQDEREELGGYQGYLDRGKAKRTSGTIGK